MTGQWAPNTLLGLRVQNRDYPHFRPVEGGCKALLFSFFLRCFADLIGKMCLRYLHWAFYGCFFCYEFVPKNIYHFISGIDFSVCNFKLKMMLCHFAHTDEMESIFGKGKGDLCFCLCVQNLHTHDFTKRSALGQWRFRR